MRTALVSLLAACLARPDLPSWDLVDLDALTAGLDRPTARQVDVEQHLEELADRVRAAQRAGEAFRLLRPVLARETDVPPQRGDAATLGTYAYVRVGCPGPVSGAARPDPDFAHGELQVDAAVNVDVEAAEFGLAGDLWLHLLACQVREVAFAGSLPAWWDTESELLSFDGEITATLDGPPRPFDLFGEASEDGARISLPVFDGRRLTLRVEGQQAVELHLADATLTCTAEGALRCDVEL